MGRITFTADEHHERISAEIEDEEDLDSTAAAGRRCIERAARLQQREADLQQRVDDLQLTVERLENEKRLILEQREENTELARYVEEECS